MICTYLTYRAYQENEDSSFEAHELFPLGVVPSTSDDQVKFEVIENWVGSTTIFISVFAEGAEGGEETEYVQIEFESLCDS